MKRSVKICTQNSSKCHSITFMACLVFAFLILVFLLFQSSASSDFSSPRSSYSWDPLGGWKRTVCASNGSDIVADMIIKLRESITFLPLKDLRFTQTAMAGNTWFMSSLNDTHEENEAEYMLFPSEASKGRLLCLRGRDTGDGTRNSYALAWPEVLPETAILLEGLTFVSNTYFDYQNLWHAICVTAPFVRWSMKNGCIRPARWVLYHWGELRLKFGSWIEHLMRAAVGEVKVEGFDNGDVPYCFEKAVVMRHEIGAMTGEKKLQVSELLRCKARSFCGLNPAGRGREINERGVPLIRFTLLMRRGNRSFKNATAVTEIFAKECARIDGCILDVAQSEDLTFCDQVKVMTNTDIVASPHGAQLTNMLFMDKNSSIMEFFPKGWLEHAGVGQYAHHWMAAQSGMKHQGAWWDTDGDECPTPKDNSQCFSFYKNGKVGHNETFFAEWARKVLENVRLSKLEQASQKQQENKPQLNSKACQC